MTALGDVPDLYFGYSLWQTSPFNLCASSERLHITISIKFESLVAASEAMEPA